MAKKEKAFFEGIREAMAEGIEAMREGRPLTQRDVVAPGPPAQMTADEITRLRRDKLGVSQAVFASLMNVALQTVHAWEQGRNKPSGCALRLLRLVDGDPSTFTGMLRGEGSAGAEGEAKSRSA